MMKVSLSSSQSHQAKKDHESLIDKKTKAINYEKIEHKTKFIFQFLINIYTWTNNTQIEYQDILRGMETATVFLRKYSQKFIVLRIFLNVQHTADYVR